MSDLDPRESGPSKRALILIFTLALLARGALLVAGPARDASLGVVTDSARYITLATNLREYRTFGKAEEEGIVHCAIARLREANGTLPPRDCNGLRPEGFRTPAYPAFIATITAVFNDLRSVMVVQCLLGALAAIAAARVGTALGLSSRGAMVVGLVWAVHPGLVVFDVLILTESLFNALTVFAMFFATRSSIGASLASGALVGAAGLVRPLGLIYLPAVILARPTTGRRISAVALMAATAVLPSALWAVRNSAVGEGLRVCTTGDVNLLFYMAGYTISEERGEDWLETWPERVDELAAELGRRVRPGEDVFQVGRGLATEELRKRPVFAARVLAKAGMKLAISHSAPDLAHVLGTPYEASGFLTNLVFDGKAQRIRTNFAALAGRTGWCLLNLLLALGAIVGSAVAMARRSWRLLIPCGVTVFLFIAATNAVGLERFRLPIMLPLLALGASLVPDPAEEGRAVSDVRAQ